MAEKSVGCVGSFVCLLARKNAAVMPTTINPIPATMSPNARTGIFIVWSALDFCIISKL
jgi:hypothetical protein